MGVGIVPWTPGSSVPTSSFSYPNRASLVFFDDGGGGSLLINGLGVTGVGFSDLRTIFTSNGALFNSIPLLSAFRRLTANTDYAAQAQLISRLDVAIETINNSVLAPAINYLGGTGGNDFVPFLAIDGPAAVGTWRIELKLRHSITN